LKSTNAVVILEITIGVIAVVARVGELTYRGICRPNVGLLPDIHNVLVQPRS
jgi:hypothetical protein